MPFVACPSCPKTFYVSEINIEAAKAAHTDTHIERDLPEPEFDIYMTEEEVPVAAHTQALIALQEGEWYPKTKEG